jgi:hypothetical protein
MPKLAENPKKFIVSCRVDDYEMRILQNRASQAGVTITKLIRRCLELPESERCPQSAANRSQACG